MLGEGGGGGDGPGHLTEVWSNDCVKKKTVSANTHQTQLFMKVLFTYFIVHLVKLKRKRLTKS